MFKLLKEKLKNAVSKITKKIEEAPEIEEEALEVKEEPKEKKRFFDIFKRKEELKEEKIEEKEEKKEKKPKEIKPEKIKEKRFEEEKVKEKEERIEEKPKEEKKGFLEKLKEKITTRTINETQFDEYFNELEIALLENNVAYEVIDKIKNDLRDSIVNIPIKRDKILNTIQESLKHSIEELFDKEKIDLIKKIKEKSEKPFVIVFFGINGSGKTTTIAKIVKLLQDHKLSSVIAASDTFRAAAIQQLEEHGKELNTRVIKHDYGADSTAVAFDALKHAKARGIDVVLIDTAGRMHSNVNLLDEMKKIVRVCKPDLKIFVGESITGNDCVIQSQSFDESIGIDAIILTKSDVDEKGGAIVSVSYITRKPILYLGIGQKMDDLEKFDPKKIIEKIGL